jgi:hypothetical protein
VKRLILLLSVICMAIVFAAVEPTCVTEEEQELIAKIRSTFYVSEEEATDQELAEFIRDEGNKTFIEATIKRIEFGQTVLGPRNESRPIETDLLEYMYQKEVFMTLEFFLNQVTSFPIATIVTNLLTIHSGYETLKKLAAVLGELARKTSLYDYINHRASGNDEDFAFNDINTAYKEKIDEMLMLTDPLFFSSRPKPEEEAHLRELREELGDYYEYAYQSWDLANNQEKRDNIKRYILGWIEQRRPTPTPTPPATLLYETDSTLSSVSVSANGDYIAVGSSDKIYFLNRDTGFLWDYSTDFPITDVSMTADASYIVAGGSKGTVIPDGIVYWLTKEGKLKNSISPTGVSSVSYSGDGNYFAMTYIHWLGWQDTIAFWGYNENKWLWHYTFGRDETSAVSISADGGYIAVGGAADPMHNDGGLRLYNKRGDLLWEYAIDTGILAGDKYSVSISADGQYIAAGNRDNENLYFFNRDQQFLWSYPTGPIEGLAVSADGSHVVAASRDKAYFFGRSGNLLWTLAMNDIKDIAMSADAETIVAVTGDNKVYALNP